MNYKMAEELTLNYLKSEIENCIKQGSVTTHRECVTLSAGWITCLYATGLITEDEYIKLCSEAYKLLDYFLDRFE